MRYSRIVWLTVAVILIMSCALVTTPTAIQSPPLAPPTATQNISPTPASVPSSSPESHSIATQEHMIDVLTQISQIVDVNAVQFDYAEVELLSITYLSDGLAVKGYLAMPTVGENLPCVIFNRGGNRETGALSDNMAGNLLGKIASWGYVVVASQYRGNAGGEGLEEYGGADVNDVLNLIPLLESLPRADATRIGMFGWSRGGMMTYIALARTDRISAAIVGSGVADLAGGLEDRPVMEAKVYAELIPNYASEKEEALAARSAINWPEKLCKNTPILLLHGSADSRVSPTQVLRMAQALYENQHPFRFVFFEGGGHGLSEYQEEVDELLRDWLDDYVRDQNTWPSLEPHE